MAGILDFLAKEAVPIEKAIVGGAEKAAVKAAPAAIKAEESMIRAPGRAGGSYPTIQAGSQVLRDMPAMNAGAGSLSRELPKGAAPLPSDVSKGGGFSEAMKSLGITNPSSALGTAGLLGGMALYSGKQAQKAQEQGQAMVGQEKAIAQPYQIQGREMAQQALAGDMTPATQQAYKAAQAQIQQNVATSGGVGQQQAGIQLEAFRQQLLQNQYQYGIQMSQIGDNIALGAIQDSMQLNQNLNSISNSFYSNLGNIAAMSMGNYSPMMYGMQQPTR